MNKFALTFSRGIDIHAVKLAVVSAALFISFFLVLGPSYGALFARAAAFAEQLGAFTVIGLCIFLVAIRKKKPGFTWNPALADYASWCLRSAAERLACTSFFLGVAIFCMCSGVVVGVIFVSFVWRVM